MIYRKSYVIGVREKHRIGFFINFLTGTAGISCDGKVIYRKPLFAKLDRSFEVGEREKHLVKVYFCLADLFRLQSAFYIRSGGMNLHTEDAVHRVTAGVETAIDESACAFFYVAIINILYSLKGFLFTREPSATLSSTILVFTGLLYLLIGIRTIRCKRGTLIIGTIFFLADTLYGVFMDFSIAGLLVRGLIFYYLLSGLSVMPSQKMQQSA